MNRRRRRKNDEDVVEIDPSKKQRSNILPSAAMQDTASSLANRADAELVRLTPLLLPALLLALVLVPLLVLLLPALLLLLLVLAARESRP